MRLPESSIHDFARDMVVALQFLHANSIIYCDIKPSNILLDENGRLKLGGFGLSRRLSDINKNPVTNLPPVSVRGGGACAQARACWQLETCVFTVVAVEGLAALAVLRTGSAPCTGGW